MFTFVTATPAARLARSCRRFRLLRSRPGLGLLALLLAGLVSPGLLASETGPLNASHTVVAYLPEDGGPGQVTLELRLTNTGFEALSGLILEPLPGPVLLGHGASGAPQQLLVEGPWRPGRSCC